MTTEQRFAKLDRTNRRWRWLAGSLGLVLISLAGMGQAQQAPKELVLEKLTISDGKDGATIVLLSGNRYAGILMRDANKKTRIMVKTLPTGTAGIDHFDTAGKRRMEAATEANGSAKMSHFDTNGKTRVVATTLPTGTAGINHFDSNGKQRISVSTDVQGMAAVSHHDAKEGPRIVIATAPDGTAGTIYQNYNTNGELELVRTLP